MNTQWTLYCLVYNIGKIANLGASYAAATWKDSGGDCACNGACKSRESLPEGYQDHPLRGDCHLEPDWMLIYRLADDELRWERTGSHSDIFG